MLEPSRRGESVVIQVLLGLKASLHPREGIKVSFSLFLCLVLMFEGNVDVEVNPRVEILELELSS